MWLVVYSPLVQPPPISNSRTFASPPKETLYPWAANHSPPSWALLQTLIYFLSQCRPNSGHSHEWTHARCSLVRPLPFTSHVIFKDHPRSGVCCYILFICLFQMSVDGHLGCLHFWLSWIMPAHPFMYKLLCRRMFSILLGIYLGRTLMGHWVTPCFKFLRKTPTCFPHQLYHCTSLPAVYKCSNFSTSLSMIAILVFLNYCCYSPSGFEVLSHLGFDLHFP